MKTELLFKDRPSGELIPLKILIIGKSGSGKNTLAEMFTESNPFLVAESHDFYDPNEANICVGCPDQEALDQAIAAQSFTHIFWVEAGNRTHDGETNLTCQPFSMIIVDNTLGLGHLFEEAGYCMSMMGVT